MINKYVRKSLARKNGNEILIWSWNNPGKLATCLAVRAAQIGFFPAFAEARSPPELQQLNFNSHRAMELLKYKAGWTHHLIAARYVGGRTPCSTTLKNTFLRQKITRLLPPRVSRSGPSGPHHRFLPGRSPRPPKAVALASSRHPTNRKATAPHLRLYLERPHQGQITGSARRGHVFWWHPLPHYTEGNPIRPMARPGIPR